MHTLWLDLETYSALRLKAVGAYHYAEEAEIMLVQYAWDDQPVTVWEMADDRPGKTAELQSMVNAAERVVTHSQFDPIVLQRQNVLIPIEKREDTMVLALEHGMPGGLDMLCDILDVPTDQAKLKDGKKLIQLFCSPRKKGRSTKHTHPVEWARFLEYAASDIEAMREVHRRLPRWNWTATERAYWHLDIATNDVGLQVDVELATAALAAFQRTKKALAVRTNHLTNGALQATTQRAALMEHLVKVHGVELRNMTAKVVEETLEDDDLDPVVRELLENRLKASATSPAKYKALLISSCVDGRLRGVLQFCGAARTGRDAGRIFQPQNLPRATLGSVAIEMGIAAMKGGYEELLFDVIDLCVSAVRGAIIACEGQTLIVSDLSNIEGRSLAWMVDETWKLDAFRDYDKGVGDEIYKITAGRIIGKEPKDVTKDERQKMGKVPELACGYQGAVGAFRRMGGPSVEAMSNDEISNIVRQWRARHPKTKAFWYAMEDAATSAILKPGESFSCGPITFDLMDGPDGAPYLRMRLPSGRYLCYRHPQCAAAKCIFCDGAGVVRLTPDSKYMECPECDGQGSFGEDGLTYEGVDQYSRKWKRLTTYGGKLTENANQALARDIFFHGMRIAMGKGFRIVLRVHDELVAEVPDDSPLTLDDLSACLTVVPSWATGLPLAASGFTAKRYRKD